MASASTCFPFTAKHTSTWWQESGICCILWAKAGCVLYLVCLTIELKGREFIHFCRAACHASVSEFSGSRYQGYSSNDEAAEAWEHAVACGDTGPAVAATSSRVPIVAATRSRSTAAVAATQAIPRPSDNEQVWWVVTKGICPGVYRGRCVSRSLCVFSLMLCIFFRTAALIAVGDDISGAPCVLQCACNLAEADHIFVSNYMDGQVVSCAN